MNYIIITIQFYNFIETEDSEESIDASKLQFINIYRNDKVDHFHAKFSDSRNCKSPVESAVHHNPFSQSNLSTSGGVRRSILDDITGTQLAENQDTIAEVVDNPQAELEEAEEATKRLKQQSIADECDQDWQPKKRLSFTNQLVSYITCTYKYFVRDQSEFYKLTNIYIYY